MTTSTRKKHPCPDCRQCQQCSPARCHLCRGHGAERAEARFAAMSMAEQIQLFKAVNRKSPQEDGRQGCECRAGSGAFQ